jgi:hypothetical protein
LKQPWYLPHWLDRFLPDLTIEPSRRRVAPAPADRPEPSQAGGAGPACLIGALVFTGSAAVLHLDEGLIAVT